MESKIIKFPIEYIIEKDYAEIICGTIKADLPLENDIQYIFPQIKKWGPSLKRRVWEKLRQLNISKDFNVWFVTIKTEEAIFKVIFID